MSATARGSTSGTASNQRSLGRNATNRCALTAVMKLAPSAAATAPVYSSGALTVSTKSSQKAPNTTHHAAQNPGRADVPIIFTELGADAKRGADRQAHALVKAYAMSIAQGVASVVVRSSGASCSRAATS